MEVLRYMQDVNIFELNSTSCKNVEGILREMGTLHELSVCELSFAAESAAKSISELLDAGMTVNEATSLLSDEISLPDVRDEERIPSLTSENVKSFLSHTSNLNKVIFAELLVKRLAELGITVSEGDYLPGIDSEETFAYVKNSLSDEAFDVFSQEFSDPRIVYADNFKDACRMVADGKVGYCILPFEEKGGARINSIVELVSSLDLKIAAITPVFGFEGNADVKYALVGRGFTIPENDEFTDRYLEIEVHRNSSLSLGELISASEYLSLSIFSVNTTSNAIADGDFIHTLIFKDEKKSFTDFLTYLNIFAGSHTPVGIYKNIE